MTPIEMATNTGLYSLKDDHEADWLTGESCDCATGGDRWTKTDAYRPNPRGGT